MICGALAAVSSSYFAIYTRSISPASHGNFYELYGIALGAVLLQILQNLVNLLGIPSSLNFAVMGTVILIGVVLDAQLQRLRGRKAMTAHASRATGVVSQSKAPA